MKWRDTESLADIKPGRVSMRASEICAVYEADDEDGNGMVLVALFTGEVRVSVTKPYLQVLTEGDFYWLDTAIDQTHLRSSDVVFTSLDRPSPLSPEMLAIQQLTKRNDLERERTRSDIERLKHDNDRLLADAREHQKRAQPHTAVEAEKVRPDAGGSPDDAGKPQGDANRQLSDAAHDYVPKGTASDIGGDENSGKRKTAADR